MEAGMTTSPLSFFLLLSQKEREREKERQPRRTSLSTRRMVMQIEGIEVVDAKRKQPLRITQNDVKAGKTKDPVGCAAAVRLLQMPGVEKVKVHISRTFILKKGKWLRYRTSPALRTEIISFDRAGVFEPGDYELVPLSKSEQQHRGKAHSLGAPPHGRPGHHRRKPHTLTGVRTHALCGVRSKKGAKNKIH